MTTKPGIVAVYCEHDSDVPCSVFGCETPREFVPFEQPKTRRCGDCGKALATPTKPTYGALPDLCDSCAGFRGGVDDRSADEAIYGDW